jgi:stearoyl-CoA desaturase (delta-9 desaturase)
VVSWVADHRKHLAFSDRPGPPHSLHVDHLSGGGERRASSCNSHVGWHDERGSRARYAPDLLADPVIESAGPMRVAPGVRPGNATRSIACPRPAS